MYNYNEIKSNLFTEEGQVMFLKIRDRVNYLLKEAGAVRLNEAIKDVTGSTFDMIACLDRMVELKELKEVTQSNCWGQYRVFVAYYE